MWGTMELISLFFCLKVKQCGFSLFLKGICMGVSINIKLDCLNWVKQIECNLTENFLCMLVDFCCCGHCIFVFFFDVGSLRLDKISKILKFNH